MPKSSKAENRDANGYSLLPINVSKTCWLYGDVSGLTVVQEERDINGEHVRTLQSVIPWDRIDKARDRKQGKQ